jgi:hypothetical protein
MTSSFAENFDCAPNALDSLDLWPIFGGITAPKTAGNSEISAAKRSQAAAIPAMKMQQSAGDKRNMARR